MNNNCIETTASVTSIEIHNETGLPLDFRVMITPDGRAVVTLLPSKAARKEWHYPSSEMTLEQFRERMREEACERLQECVSRLHQQG